MRTLVATLRWEILLLSHSSVLKNDGSRLYNMEHMVNIQRKDLNVKSNLSNFNFYHVDIIQTTWSSNSLRILTLVPLHLTMHTGPPVSVESTVSKMEKNKNADYCSTYVLQTNIKIINSYIKRRSLSEVDLTKFLIT